MWFEIILGLKINLEISELIPIGVGSNMEDLIGVLGCKVGVFPTINLSLPLGGPYKSFRVWEGVEERFQRRLAMWKRQYLSKGERLTLVKSTLSSLSINFMSLFVILKRIAVRLKKIQRDFPFFFFFFFCGEVALEH